MSFKDKISLKVKTFSEQNALTHIIKDAEHKIDYQYKVIGKLYLENYGENPGEEFREAIDLINSSNEKIEQAKAELEKVRNRFKCPNCKTPFKSGALYCSKCGTKLPEEEKAETQVAKKCSQCGNLLKKEAVFCNKCGNKLDEPVEISAAEQTTETVNAVSLQKKPATTEEKPASVILTTTHTELNNPEKKEKPAETPVNTTETEVSDKKDTTENNAEAITAKKICPDCKNEINNADIFCDICGHKFE